MNNQCIPKLNQYQGFSMIEFLIASALSMIVLMAISSSYFTARNLHHAAASRLSVQQSLRHAATMMTRDIRMAGSFGCFNMPMHPATAVITDSSAHNAFRLSHNQQTIFMPIQEINLEDLSISGFTPKSKALVLQYGIDSTASKETTVISNCSFINKPGKKIQDIQTARLLLKLSNDSQNGSITILRHIVNAYMVGTSHDISGLFRLQLADNGERGNPQLLVKNVSSMNIHYFYTTPNSCPTSTSPTETFDYQSTLQTGKQATAPVAVHITLKGGGSNTDHDNENKVPTYHIYATIRGGNICANRAL